MKYCLFLVLSIVYISMRTYHFPEIPKIMVFIKTNGYRHSSISTGVVAIQKLGKDHGFGVDTTSNNNDFNAGNLKKYAAVLFLSTTGDLLNREEENAFEQYIRAGGGFVGIHAAADAEYDWKWYGHLVGGYFNGHPEQQEATLMITDHKHGSTKHLPERWIRKDEWYNFQQLDSSIHTLITIDESSYKGGTNGKHHPMAWYHEDDGGRSFYTALGHTEDSYSDTLFLQHLLGGIQYAIGKNIDNR